MTTQHSNALARAKHHSRRRARTGWLLSLPSITVMALLTLAPVVSVVIGALNPKGFERLLALAETPSFTQMLGNTVVWVIVGSVGSLVIGFAAALALNHPSVKLSGVWRSLLILPWVTPAVVSATAWKWFYSRDYGILNAFLQQIGVISEPVSWLTDSKIALLALVMVHVWGTFSFVMLMISAGLQGVPLELYEAAKLDGANAVQRFRNVTIPSLSDIVFIVGIIVTVWALNSFIPIWVISRGGPAGATNILSIELYRAFQVGDVSTISVIALIQLVLSGLLAILYVYKTRKADDR